MASLGFIRSVKLEPTKIRALSKYGGLGTDASIYLNGFHSVQPGAKSCARQNAQVGLFAFEELNVTPQLSCPTISGSSSQMPFRKAKFVVSLCG